MREKIKAIFLKIVEHLFEIFIILIAYCAVLVDSRISNNKYHAILVTGSLLIACIICLIYKYIKISSSTESNYREYLVQELKDVYKQNVAGQTEQKQKGVADKEHLSEIEAQIRNDLPKRSTNNKRTHYTNIDISGIVTTRDKRDILALMLKNHDEIVGYFQISKSQAKLSFYFSVFACILGFVMLGVAICGIFVIDNFQIAIIGAVSGAITEVVAGTVLIIHNKSVLQLNHYYDALHQNEKFLSAVTMADKLSDEKREDMYIEIIRKQIDLS